MSTENTEPISSMPSNAVKVFTGKIFDVYQWEVEGYDGQKRIFERLKRPDTAVVIPITEDGKIIIANEEQPGKAPYITCVGGRIEEGEEPLIGAQRELLEETGYVSESWELFDSFQPASKIDWTIFTYVAKNCKKISEQNLDGAEKIKIMYKTLEEFVEFILSDDNNFAELKLVFLQAKLDGTLETLLRKFQN